MKIRLVAARPKAQGCTDCPANKVETQTPRQTLIGIGSTQLGLVNGLVSGSTLGLPSEKAPCK